MEKEEINKKIYALNSDEDILEFIKERIIELEKISKEQTVGQNYTDSFRDYIASNVHFKPAEKIGDVHCPDLVFDDYTPYLNLIKEIKKGKWYNELTLLSTIFFVINDYLGKGDDISTRFFVYDKHKQDGFISIKEIKENKCAFCSEISALAHNMFKFLGIDSEFICGTRDKENHAYLILYPNGYDKVPAALYDPSYFVSFVRPDGEKYSFGYYCGMQPTVFENFKSGEPFRPDLTKVENTYRKLYGWNGLLDGCLFEGDTPVYTYGLGYSHNRK